jgi:hypothetical protein
MFFGNSIVTDIARSVGPRTTRRIDGVGLLQQETREGEGQDTIFSSFPSCTWERTCPPSCTCSLVDGFAAIMRVNHHQPPSLLSSTVGVNSYFARAGVGPAGHCTQRFTPGVARSSHTNAARTHITIIHRVTSPANPPATLSTTLQRAMADEHAITQQPSITAATTHAHTGTGKELTAPRGGKMLGM